MKQIIQVDDNLKKKIIDLEIAVEALCQKLEQKFQPEFKNNGRYLVIELLRTKNGEVTTNEEILENYYESSVEIGIEHGEEYFPNTSIPVWKCKTEWFQKIGYLTNKNTMELQKMISSLVMEMLDDKE